MNIRYIILLSALVGLAGTQSWGAAWTDWAYDWVAGGNAAANKELLDAAKEGDLGRVRYALDSGANVEVRNLIGYTPLIEAAMKGHAPIVDLLIQAGADVNAIEPVVGNTALIGAIYSKNVQMVQALLDATAGVEVTGRESPLLAAAYTGNVEVVKALLNAGADVSKVDRYGRGVLLMAVARGSVSPDGLVLFRIGEPDLQMIRALLDAGADPRVRDRRDASAHDIARRLGYDNVVRMFDAWQPLGG